MSSRYHQIVDNEWTPILRCGQRDMCCGCGLVHDIDTREVNGVLEVRKSVNSRATAAARRSLRFKK